MKKNLKTKEEKGITLVALVVTIIILLILSGIGISVLTQTGLFDKAKQAKEITDNKYEEENMTLAEYNNKINDIISNREYNTSYSLTKIGEIKGGDKIELKDCEKYDEIFVRIKAVTNNGITYYTYTLPISLLDDEEKNYQIMSTYANPGYYGGMTISRKNINMYAIRRDNVDYTNNSILEVYGKKY